MSKRAADSESSTGKLKNHEREAPHADPSSTPHPAEIGEFEDPYEDEFESAPPLSARPPINFPAESPSFGAGGDDQPSVQICKSFRVSMDDPCHKVLPAALRKYNIADHWRHFRLYIQYGDQERCLEMDERPLILYKQLQSEGLNPMFMLRRVNAAAGDGGVIGSAVNIPPGGII